MSVMSEREEQTSYMNEICGIQKNGIDVQTRNRGRDIRVKGTDTKGEEVV